ncbi:MAG TPA: prolyl aminopeptidase [bacterium]|jgi:proline iminopeptidase
MSRHILYPPIEPYATGRLKVSDLHEIFYEEVGNPNGQPAVFLHGGPGVGIIPDYRRFFDPQKYRVVLVDQRGSGRSTPHAELRENTTWDLVEDLEKVRRHLGIDRWVVLGGSWGSTLALCYAISHPAHVKGVIIRGVFLARPSETVWTHKFGMSEIYPDEWVRFQSLIPEAERDDMVKAYYVRLTGEDKELQLKAAQAWDRWESATMCLFPDPATLEVFEEPQRALSVGRIECAYTYHDFFMKSDNWILENASAMRNIPLRMVQGRYDVICPVRAAWDLHQVLPNSDLRIIPDGSHSPLDDGMIDQLVQATIDFQTL